jgi:sensor histidine kinase YesM
MAQEDHPYSAEKSRKIIHKDRERLIRLIAILIIGFVLPFIYEDVQLFTRDYFLAIGMSILRTAALWIGSEFLVETILNIYDIFKSTAKAITILAVTLVVYTCLIITIEIWTLEHVTSYQYAFREKLNFYEMACLITLFITTLYASTFFFISWRENLLKAERLEKATIEARFETLKNQVNPHFLFNSLNTLAGMLNETSEELEYVQNLSACLRNVLLSSGKSLVTLREELEFAKKYTYIQQKRFRNKLQIEFEIPDAYLLSEIPPLALQMLIENAIKHNIISSEKPLKIRVYVEENHLVVENNLQRKALDEQSGLGLENINSRYLFLGSEKISVEETADQFIVRLALLS